MLGRKTSKAQSAMEYLMTYGWAILIIAVVLGALFSLGVFGGVTVGTACVAAPGYLCSGPTLNAIGQLSFTFGQSTGVPIYNVEMSCTATTNALGLPVNALPWFPINTGGVAVTMNTGNVMATNTLGGLAGFVSGQTQSIVGLPCFGTTGTLLGSTALSNTVAATIGVSFSGYLFLNYTTTYCSSGTGCTWYTLKMATLSLKVV